MEELLYEVTMPDGSRWVVAVMAVARNRAAHYAHEFGGDTERSLIEDTIPLFNSDHYEIRDWASNNMNWSDVVDYAVQVGDPPPVDYQEGWVNGGYRIRTTRI